MTLRVLHFIYDDPRNPWVAGGGAVRVFELYRRLVGDVDATVVTGSYPGARDEVIEGVRYRRLGARRPYAWSRWTYARQATRLLREAEYEAAVFDFSAYTPLRLPPGRKVGITVHHLTGPTARARWGTPLGRLIAARERGTLRSARHFSATSAVTRELLERIVTPGSRIVAVGAGVPDDLFTLERREEGYLLYFGRLDWFQKGIDTLLAAAALLAKRYPALELRVAGRGKDLPRARALADELGITARVRFLGGVSDEERRELFAHATVMLMPSRFEGFGLAAAEAMAAGVPLVAASAGSLPEVVSPPAGGVLVPPDDAGALARAAGELLDDPARRATLSASARGSAERFRWDAVARQHLDFLRMIQRGEDG